MRKKKMRIEIPSGANLMRHDGGLRIRGTAAQIIEVSNQIRKLRELPIGGFAQLDDFELTVADRPSSFNKRIAMPADAWNIMASKFIEVATGWEESPLDFNDCGYLYPRLDTDLGVELVGEPKKDRSI
jgi:hypothetical protein